MLTEKIEALLNRQAATSPRAGALIAALQGKRLVIDVQHTPWQLAVASNGQALQLSRRDLDAADATIRGTPLSLAALAGPQPAAVIRRGDVAIEGDAETADRFRELGTLLHPDIEEELAQLIGDVPAHQLGLVARTALGWLRRSLRTGSDNVAEYLAHESRELVPRVEAQGYLRDVDVLREDVDRLQARIDALAAQAAPP
jgi:ubiquinone biosynthesis protein UbiJ